MEKNNATCSICGNGYHICLSCHDSMKLYPWKVHCCSASHFQVFQIVRGLSTGVYTKDEAKEKFQNVNLEDLDSFRPHIKKIIKDVLKEEKTVVKAIEKIKPAEMTDAEIKEEVAVEDVVNEDVNNIVEPVLFRKKNYKVETK